MTGHEFLKYIVQFHEGDTFRFLNELPQCKLPDNADKIQHIRFLIPFKLRSVNRYLSNPDLSDDECKLVYRAVHFYFSSVKSTALEIIRMDRVFGKLHLQETEACRSTRIGGL